MTIRGKVGQDIWCEWERINFSEFWNVNLKEEVNLEDQGVGEGIILNFT
jgi:hypothetical protein